MGTQPNIRVSFLGQFALWDNSGSLIKLNNRKSLAVFLVLLRDGHAERQALSELLWSKSHESQRRNSLRQSLAELRRALGTNDYVQNIGKHSLTISKNAVCSDLQAIQVSNDPEFLRSKISAAPEFLLGLDGLDPEFDEWLYQTRQELRSETVGLLEEALRSYKNKVLGKPQLVQCELLRRLDPYSDLAATKSIIHEVNRGNTAHAAQRFLKHKKLLEDDLQVAPTFDISDFIASASAEKVKAMKPQFISEDAEWCREDIIRDFRDVMKRVEPLQGQVVFVTGPSGVGKTYTVEKFLRRHSTSQQKIVSLGGPDYVGGSTTALLSGIENRLSNEFAQELDQTSNSKLQRQHSPNAFIWSHAEASSDHDSITGSIRLDELILHSVEGPFIVLFFDDAHLMSNDQVRTMEKILAVCQRSNCLIFIATKSEPSYFKDEEHLSFRLAALNRSQVREFLSSKHNGPQSSEYVSSIVAMSLGLPVLIQRALDHARILGDERHRALTEEKSNGLRAQPTSSVFIDQVLMALPPGDKTSLKRISSFGGKIKLDRFVEVFGRSPIAAESSLLDFRLINKDLILSRNILSISHELIGERSKSIPSPHTVFNDHFYKSIPTLNRNEMSAIVRYMVDFGLEPMSDTDFLDLISRLSEFEMWHEIIMLVEETRGNSSYFSASENLYLRCLYNTQRYVSFAREYTPNPNQHEPSLKKPYAQACAYIGATPKFGIESEYTSFFYRGKFKKVLISTESQSSLEIHGYRAMALAQLGRFKDAREEVSEMLSLVTEDRGEEDRHLAEFFRQYVLTHQGEFSGAISNLRRSLLSLHGRSGEFVHSLLQIHLGFVLVLLGYPESGLRTLKALQETLPLGETGVLAGYAETALTSALLGCGKIGEASSMAEKSLQTAMIYNLESVEVWARRNIFRANWDEKSLPYLEEATAMASRLEMTPDWLHLIRLKGNYYLDRGSNELGQEMLSEAERGYHRIGMIGSFKQSKGKTERV